MTGQKLNSKGYLSKNWTNTGCSWENQTARGAIFNKEKPYRRTMPLDTRGGPPSQVEDRNKEGWPIEDTLTISLKTVTKHIITSTGLHHKCYTCGKEGHFTKHT
ncbi:hypothetical protein TNCV_66261 [Trichonephila clavipes]|nr:hypothetical protein TNCV_66261 [Trichonephila clavipes]